MEQLEKVISEIKRKSEREKLITIKEIFSDPKYHENGELLYSMLVIANSISTSIANELMEDTFAKGRNERYKKFVEPHMKCIEDVTFEMGNNDAMSYCGEGPKHKVMLSKYLISEIPVTENLYHLYNQSYSVEKDSNKPVTMITWYDAYMFSYWMGARLLTEAEWEYASSSNNNDHWCCAENELIQYAWFSENSNGEIHPIAEKKANKFGLFDMHGNVWEWCLDSYDTDYYSKAALKNPCNKEDSEIKVCRGGSIHAFPEMCRKEFRSYEIASFKAYDLGMRLAKDIK